MNFFINPLNRISIEKYICMLFSVRWTVYPLDYLTVGLFVRWTVYPLDC